MKRYFYLSDIDTVETVETITKKELLNIAEGLKGFTFSKHDDVISGYRKDGTFFYYDWTNFVYFKKSDIVNAVSIVYSSEAGYYVYGDYMVNMYGVVSPTETGETLIWSDDNIKEVNYADYTEEEEEEVTEQETTEEETTQEAENMTINNYDEVREQLIEELKDLELRKPNYQTDIYLYIDESGNGKIDTFVNVGGNSWINDDHITIYCDKEHYNTIMDDLSDGESAWNWLINELENYFKISGIKEQLFKHLIKTFNEDGDGDAKEYYKDLSDFEYYDIEQALGKLYYEEIEKYYKDWFIPECCMDGIELLADEILEEYKK